MVVLTEKVSGAEETAATRKQEETNALRIGTHRIEREGGIWVWQNVKTER